jgi:hypothetical protein
MKKLILVFLSCLFAITNCISQDIITKKNGEDIQAKVVEITTSDIKYRKFDNLDGPLFTMLKSDVLMIRYSNGSKDIFNETQSEAKQNTPPPSDKQNQPSADLTMQGRQDARNYYKGKNSGAGWTAATTIILSPVFGLIPAIACSSTQPSDENLNYREPELMKDRTYYPAYVEQAHKTKKRKVWTNFGIGSGVWLLLVLLL